MPRNVLIELNSYYTQCKLNTNITKMKMGDQPGEPDIFCCFFLIWQTGFLNKPYTLKCCDTSRIFKTTNQRTQWCSKLNSLWNTSTCSIIIEQLRPLHHYVIVKTQDSDPLSFNFFTFFSMHVFELLSAKNT